MKQVDKCDYKKLLEIRPELADLISWNTDPEKYGAVLRKGKMDEPSSDVSYGDLKKMLEVDYIEEINQEEVRRVGRVFTVVEAEKHRRRLIFWPRQLNKEIKACDMQELGLEPTMEDTLEAVQDLETTRSPGIHVNAMKPGPLRCERSFTPSSTLRYAPVLENNRVGEKQLESTNPHIESLPSSSTGCSPPPGNNRQAKSAVDHEARAQQKDSLNNNAEQAPSQEDSLRRKATHAELDSGAT
eukprot:gene21650-1230_t